MEKQNGGEKKARSKREKEEEEDHHAQRHARTQAHTHHTHTNTPTHLHNPIFSTTCNISSRRVHCSAIVAMKREVEGLEDRERETETESTIQSRFQ